MVSCICYCQFIQITDHFFSCLVIFNLEDTVNVDRYSAEYRFGDGCVSSIILEQISRSHKVCEDVADINRCSHYLIALFEGIKDVFTAETRLMKINAPAVVMGDILGNLDSVLTIQTMLCPSVPVIPTTMVFLGNYLGNGSHSFEVLCYLYALKLQSPDKVCIKFMSSVNLL